MQALEARRAQERTDPRQHLIDSGVDPHTAMAFSGHRTPSMLRRYHIIDLDELRRAAERAQRYAAPGRGVVTPLRGR